MAASGLDAAKAGGTLRGVSPTAPVGAAHGRDADATVPSRASMDLGQGRCEGRGAALSARLGETGWCAAVAQATGVGGFGLALWVGLGLGATCGG